MAQVLDPITQRDYSAGRIAKSAVATSLMPNYSSHTLTSAINSVANSINVDYSEIIGSGIVRKGKRQIVQIAYSDIAGQAFASPVSSNEKPVYGTNFLAQGFAPTFGQTQTLAFSLQLYKVGSNMNYLTLNLQGSTGTQPNGVNIIDPIIFDVSQITTTSYPGRFFNFFVTAQTVLSASLSYFLVLSYPNGDPSDNIEWMRSAVGSSSGPAMSSTDSGATWSTLGGSFCFIQRVIDDNTPYNRKPLGNYSWLNDNIGENVVAFSELTSPNTTGVIYFFKDYTIGGGFPVWESSTLNNLSPTDFVRFANLDGSVFEANGVDPMHDSADNGQTWGTTNSITTDSVIPSILLVSDNRMLATGYSGYPARIYFSSLVDPSNSQFITWSTDPTAGDFIDINAGADGVITGLANNSNLVLVFTTNAMYRLNTIAKSVDAENMFNVGAVSQEVIVNCLGITYFYSGKGIYSTDSTFPQQISRIGVQDFVDAITDPLQVYAWADEFNVYFSIGTVTISYGPEDFRTYSNVVLKFSPRDQSWQVMSYNQYLAQTSSFGPTGEDTGFNIFGTYGIKLPNPLCTEYDGYLSFLNTGTISDDNKAIPYELETQEQEFGDRSHTKDISDKIVVFTRNGNEGSFSVKENDGDFKSANITLENRVNVGTDINFEAEFFTFKWKGEALGSRPIFEGYHIPVITDLGITKNSNS